MISFEPTVKAAKVRAAADSPQECDEAPQPSRVSPVGRARTQQPFVVLPTTEGDSKAEKRVSEGTEVGVGKPVRPGACCEANWRARLSALQSVGGTP